VITSCSESPNGTATPCCNTFLLAPSAFPESSWAARWARRTGGLLRPLQLQSPARILNNRQERNHPRAAIELDRRGSRLNQLPGLAPELRLTGAHVRGGAASSEHPSRSFQMLLEV
jgi:hypothetical protein